MTTIRLNLRWPVERPLCFDYDLYPKELNNLRNNPSNYVQVSENGDTVDIVDMFFHNNRVEDVDRYRIRLVQDRPFLIPHLKRKVSPKTNRHNDLRPRRCGNTLVVLLESPSIHEYDGAPNRRIAPAQGQTGCGILCHLGSFLCPEATQSLNDCGYLRSRIQDGTRLVISNPIQFETSLLYAIHEDVLSESRRRTLTNAVWKRLWDVPEIRRDFIQRLRNYNPSIIINSCTSKLSPLVCQYLAANGNINLPYIYRTHHLSSPTYSDHGLHICTC